MYPSSKLVTLLLRSSRVKCNVLVESSLLALTELHTVMNLQDVMHNIQEKTITTNMETSARGIIQCMQFIAEEHIRTSKYLN